MNDTAPARERWPQVGTYIRRAGGKQETRKVVDRTLGGDVVYCYYWRRTWYRRTVSLEEWAMWIAGGKVKAVEKGEGV